MEKINNNIQGLQSNILDLNQSKSSPIFAPTLDISQAVSNQFRIALLGTTLSGKTTLCSILTDTNINTNEILEKTSSATEFTYISNSNIQIKLLDLCGSESYLKNTLYGLTSLLPDYSMVVISGNNGLSQITKEHIGISLILKIPLFIVITKIDVTPKEILENTLEEIYSFISSPSFSQVNPRILSSDKFVQGSLRSPRPSLDIIKLSIHKQEDIILLKKYIEELALTSINNNKAPIIINKQFDKINTVYAISNILYLKNKKESDKKDTTTIINGILLKGLIHPGKNMFMGPDTKGDFHPVQINSIHNDKESIEKVKENFLCCLSITPLSPSYNDMQRKGMILVSAENPLPKSYREFTAEIVVLHQYSTIKLKYFCVIYSQNIAQSAQVIWLSKPIMKSGDVGKVKFLFAKYPECINIGDLIILFETRVRGVGHVIEINNNTSN